MLPPEICERIVDLCDLSALSSTSLLSKNWRNRSQYRLFQDPLRFPEEIDTLEPRCRWSGNEARARALILHLRAHPHLALYVESIKLIRWRSKEAEFPANGHVGNETATGATLGRLASTCLQSIRRIHWRPNEAASSDDGRRDDYTRATLVSLANLCPSVRYLSLGRCALHALSQNEHKVLVASGWLARITELELMHDLDRQFIAHKVFDTLALFTGLVNLAYIYSDYLTAMEIRVTSGWECHVERLIWEAEPELLSFINTSKRLWQLNAIAKKPPNLPPLRDFILRHRSTLEVLDFFFDKEDIIGLAPWLNQCRSLCYLSLETTFFGNGLVNLLNTIRDLELPALQFLRIMLLIYFGYTGTDFDEHFRTNSAVDQGFVSAADKGGFTLAVQLQLTSVKHGQQAALTAGLPTLHARGWLSFTQACDPAFMEQRRRVARPRPR